MEDTKGVDVNVLVQKMHVLCPNLPNSEEFNNQLRSKLEEQIKDKVPKVELEQLDLKYIIQNVKNSLSEFQKRIDESVAQQQLRRTSRVRKNNSQDSSSRCSRSKLSVSSPSTSTKAETEIYSSHKCCHQSESDLVALVQVESLPVSASTNLVTIFVPTILQEKLHSVKYKISIDLNHLDMTKKILDLNLSQLESNLKGNTEKAAGTANNGENSECKLTCEIKDDDDVPPVEGQTQSTLKKSPQIEFKVPNESESAASVESVVCIIKEKDEMPTSTKQRVPKRKYPKPPTGPPKKRGRKPGSKNKAKTEKSELARYVEMFECNGNSPSSAISQIVTSTTQNWDVLPDQSAQIAYFMNGEWTTLGAPSNNIVPTMVTTTNEGVGDAAENENFIPFDDFVNFIDNQSLDIGNNVIARVLEGTVDTQEVSLNVPQESDVNPCDENNQTSKGEPNNQDMQFDISTTKTIDNTPQSMNRRVNMAYSSKEINPNDLGLTKAQESSNVIFSTCRSMPSLDMEEGDLFCSTPQRVKISDSVIAFSMKPNGTTRSDHQSLFNQREETVTDFVTDSDKRDKLQLTSDSSGIADISKNTSSKAKMTGEVVKDMSLLEIEKDFDDSLLDFENCLDDDLLSLAPSSCFNSPIDDRFEGSNFLNVEEPQIEACSVSSISAACPAPRSHLETTLLSPQEDEINPALKSFKIPRVKPLRETSSNDDSPEKLSAVKLPRPKDTETTCYTRDPSPLSLTSPQNQLQNISLNISTNRVGSEMMSSIEISKLFGSMCYNFLADMCFENTCKFSHQLLDLSIISISVSLLRNEVLNSAYRFIWRHHKLFKLYFPIFCEEYGRRNMRRKLLTVIGDCELQPKCLPFLKNIYNALTGCGISKVNACRFVLSRVGDRSDAAINVLLEIIIETDAQMFVFAIEEFSTIEGYKFSMQNINELAAVCLRSASAELVPALIKCLINVDQTEFLTMRSPELIQLLEMIKSSGGV
ncbi:uncharacterized protein LOC129948537 [Eupeodes corollae]|uniref:uncharacterized protein LOC129948537 n=1 Tax=Eupeodes corollae TaxID=290404 RepID=UPI0024926804|nr:uncharacterized protein LOC129948537 [Eupeodes corollae]